MIDDEKREEALRKLCVGKVKDMDLGNHKTAWFALKNLPSPHKDNLKRMGYSGEKNSLLNFQIARFDPDNGAKGKLPIVPSEWHAENMIRCKLSVTEWLESRRIWMLSASWSTFTDPPNNQ